MLTPKIILYKHKTYADGTHPIILQVIKNGKPIRKVIARCKASDWLTSKNRVSPRNMEAPRINNSIDVAIRDYGVIKSLDFFSFFESEIDKVKNLQQASQFATFSMLKKMMEEFRPAFDWDNLTPSAILEFTGYLAINNNKNSIRLYMQTLKKIIKLGKKERLIKENPMDEMKFGKSKSIKNKLDIDEIRILINADLSGRDCHSRDIFISSIYLRGTRISDLLCLTPKDIQKNRLIFIENKTGKVNDYLINDDLKQIFDRNIGINKHGYIFDFLDLPQSLIKDKFMLKEAVMGANAIVRYRLRKICKILGIEKRISMHIARHSFSRLANRTIQNTSITMGLVGHSTLSVHEGYISEVSDKDEMDGYAQLVLNKLKE